ncbi:unnamed protein product [Pleuronectes platessa]|uniref:Uncharacterized protein n=1 Tax=Pleuronectes platessa TaxID=8262 RepID=A0A9N7VL17_PLEPL|nr:unnamed protein product [Pleuronectes platessa]
MDISRDSSPSHRPGCSEPPWTAALCDTVFTGQLSAGDRSHLLGARPDAFGELLLICRSAARDKTLQARVMKIQVATARIPGETKAIVDFVSSPLTGAARCVC